MKNKRILSLVTALLMTLSLCSFLPQELFAYTQVYAAGSETDEQNDKLISIDKKYLTTGQELAVSNPNGFTLKYFINGEELDCRTLVLSEQYYEKWISV